MAKMKVMTLKRDRDWIDDILEDEQCSCVQMGIIEGLLLTSSVNYLYENINLNELTYIEADKIIKDLRENDCPRDPKKQFKKMFRGWEIE